MDRKELTNSSRNDTASNLEAFGEKNDGAIENPAFVSDNAFTNFSPIDKDTGATGGSIELVENGTRIEEEYNPYKHRKVTHPTTNAETLLHLLKGSLGTGILAMPKAFSHAGYIIGSVGTILIGLLCTYCIHILIKAEYELCKRRKIPSMTYTEVAEEGMKEGPGWCKALSPYAGTIVNVFLLIYQIGTCCVYVVFVSENLKSVVNHYTGVDTKVEIFMCCIVLPLILINWVRNLKYLAPFSTFANLITLISFGIIMYYIFRDPLTLEGKEAVGHVADFPLFFGTVLFALEAIGVILPLENEMRTPQHFGGTFGVLNRGMISIVFLYVIMGLFGYLQYGDESEGSITLNLPSDTEILAQVVQVTLAFAIFITHGLACYVAIDIVWNGYLTSKYKGRRGFRYWEFPVRTGIVLITFLLAVAVPALDLFISLFGALCLSALGLAFPAMIQSSVWWYHISKKERWFMTAKNVFVFFFGLLGLIVGTYTSLEQIIERFS